MAINIQQALDYRFSPDAVNQAKQMGWNDAQISAYKQQMYQDLSRQNAVQQAVEAKQAQAQQQPQDKGNWLSHLLPSGGSIAGGLGGAAAGAALGSVVPIVGTGIGALLGGILGGAGGGALGKVGENAVEGNSDLGQGVGQEALMGGLTSLPVGAALKVGQAGFKAATGIGKAGIGDVLAQAGEKTIPSQLVGKFGAQSADQTAGQTIANAGNPGLLGRLGQRLEGAGNNLLGSQANLTRAQARTIGTNPSDVLGAVNQRTGLTRMDDMAAVAQNYTGADGAASELVRNAVGNTPGINLGDLRTVGSNLIADKAPLITGAQKNSILDQIKNSAVSAHGGSAGSLNPLANPLDALSQAQNFRAMASQLSKGATVTAENKQLANVYNGLASEIEGRLYKSPGLGEGLAAAAPDRANDLRSLAASAPNKAQADAYNKLADELAGMSNVQAVRSAQKPFVDLSKIDQATAQAQSGAGAQLGDQMQGLGKVVQRPTNALAIPLNAATPSVGGMMAKAGRALQGTGGAATAAGGQTIQGAIGRNLVERGLLGGGQAATDPNQSAEPTDANGLTATDYANAGIAAPTAATGGDPTQAQSDPTNGFGVTPDQIQQAMVQAVQSGNSKQLANLTQLYGAMQSTAKAGQGKALSSTQATQANNAVSGLSDLQAIKNTIQKDPGTIWKDALPGGSIARGLTGTTDYEAAKQNVVDVISRLRSGAAITADEAKRYMGLLPAPGDSQSSALNKINRLNQLLSGFANPQASSGSGGSDMASLLGQMSQ